MEELLFGTLRIELNRSTDEFHNFVYKASACNAVALCRSILSIQNLIYYMTHFNYAREQSS